VSSTQASWIDSSLRWLTPRRLRAQAIVLAICLWGVCAIDFATPGLFDRAGNIKFQDFLPVYISAKLISRHRASEMYDQQTTNRNASRDHRRPGRVRIPFLYGPQVGLLFVPLSEFSFSRGRRNLGHAESSGLLRLHLRTLALFFRTSILTANS